MSVADRAEDEQSAPIDALEVVRRHFAESGAAAFLVGGWVRDALIGRASVDLDVVVEADAWNHARSIAASSDGSFVGLDRSRDFARVVWSSTEGPGPILDLTRYQGADLPSDLLGRDFTVNAMAAPLDADFVGDPDQIIDPSGGLSDLDSRLIRMVSAGAFEADPLRLVRAPRLAAELGFRIDEPTRAEISKQAHLIGLPAGERIREELLRTLQSDEIVSGVDDLARLDLLPRIVGSHIAPDGNTAPEHKKKVRETVADWLSGIEAIERHVQGSGSGREVPDRVREAINPYCSELATHFSSIELGGFPHRAWVALASLVRVHHVPDPEEVSQRLRLSNAEARQLGAVVQHGEWPNQQAAKGRPSRLELFHFYRSTGRAGVDIAVLALADWAGRKDTSEFGAVCCIAGDLLAAWFRRRDEVVAPEPYLDGDDLMRELDLEPGPEVGRLLDAILEGQASGAIADRQQAIEYARQMIADKG